jgi:hypothetical protein
MSTIIANLAASRTVMNARTGKMQKGSVNDIDAKSASAQEEKK